MLMKLIVGLGNPGPKYTTTRHNAGFWWVDGLVQRLGAQMRMEARFHSEIAKVNSGGEDLWLLKPSTFMNESGRAVGAVADYFKIAPIDILIVHDELDLVPGVVKLKFGGSGSGNGVRNVISRLSTKDFWRLRIGIGHPREFSANSQEVVDYVLHAPRKEEQMVIEDAMYRAYEQWPLIVSSEMETAMHRLHTKAG